MSELIRMELSSLPRRVGSSQPKEMNAQGRRQWEGFRASRLHHLGRFSFASVWDAEPEGYSSGSGSGYFSSLQRGSVICVSSSPLSLP